MKVCQYAGYFICRLLAVSQSLLTELAVRLKFDLHPTLKLQKFSNHIFYSSPVHLGAHFQCSLLRTTGISRLQAGSRKAFLLCLLMHLLSCWYSNHKQDVIITQVPLGCLSLRAPSVQQPLNQSPKSSSCCCCSVYFHLLRPPLFGFYSADC